MGGLLVVTGVMAAGCSRSAPVPTPPTEGATSGAEASAPSASSAASVAFCAFGGQGVVPTGAGPDDYVRVVVVVDVTVAAAGPLVGVAPSSIALRNDEGVVESAMRAPIGVTRVDPIPATTTWANALSPSGPSFDGRLAPGLTRLRIEAWLGRRPRSLPLRVHVVVASPAGPIEADGAVNGEWPTG
jgi:hypothetical protein